MRTLLLLTLGICAALHADTYPRQPGIDVQHYVFRITLTDDTDEIAGETDRHRPLRQRGRHVSLLSTSLRR